jgi:hypothetical protein
MHNKLETVVICGDLHSLVSTINAMFGVLFLEEKLE